MPFQLCHKSVHCSKLNFWVFKTVLSVVRGIFAYFSLPLCTQNVEYLLQKQAIWDRPCVCQREANLADWIQGVSLKHVEARDPGHRLALFSCFENVQFEPTGWYFQCDHISHAKQQPMCSLFILHQEFQATKCFFARLLMSVVHMLGANAFILHFSKHSIALQRKTIWFIRLGVFLYRSLATSALYSWSSCSVEQPKHSTRAFRGAVMLTSWLIVVHLALRHLLSASTWSSLSSLASRDKILQRALF